MKKELLFVFFLVVWNYLPAQTILGVDVSGTAQGNINWSQVYASGKTFAWAKATEGFTFNDTKFTANMSGGIAAGMIMGAYHFARPDNNSAVNEANHFLSIAGSYIGVGKLPPVLDVEDPSSTIILQNLFTSAQLTTWVQTWLTTVQNATGIAPVIYTSSSYASYLGSSLNGYKLWIAKPDGSATTPPTGLGNWTTWAVKQYSWTGSVPGIASAVDLDVFNGSLTAFNIFIGNTASVQNFSISPNTISQCNSCFTISYAVNATAPMNVMLGASIRKTGTTAWIDDTPHDVMLNVPAGSSTQTRTFCITPSATNGTYDIMVALWADNNGNNIIDGGDIQLNSQQTASILTVSTGTLPAPVNNAAGNVSATGFTANWNSVPNATAYYLDVSLSNTFSSFVSGYNNLNVGNVTNYAITGLATNTTYYYRTRASNSSCGTSASSNYTSVQTSCTVAPTVPAVTPAGPVSICQGASTTLTVTNPCAGCTYSWSDGGTGTTHVVSTNGGYYAWSQNTCGSSSPGNTVVVNVTGAPAQPGTITGLSAVNTGQTIPYSISTVNGATGYNWSVSGGGTVSGNTNTATVTWNTPGNYTLSVAASNNCGVSTVQVLSVVVSNITSVVNLDNQQNIVVWPNPAQKEIFINAKDIATGKPVRIEIVAIGGQLVYSNSIKEIGGNRNQKIDVTGFAAGAYVIKIIAKDRLYVGKFIKID